MNAADSEFLMCHHARKFEISSISPLRGFCTFCYVKFEGMPSPYETADDVILRMRAAFDAHECKKSTGGIAAE
jgi:hypothetical protein